MVVDITVASRGDIIFRLGDEDDLPTKVLVSSIVMSLLSPVFNAMLNGSFAEGQALSPEQPREVALPADNTQAMLLVCRIAHMQTSDLPVALSINAFAEFARVADKYQCTGAVQAWGKVWVAKICENSPGADFERLVLAIYMLDLPEDFRKATTILARDRVADIQTIEHDDAVVAMFKNLQAAKRSNEAQMYTTLNAPIVYLGQCEQSKVTLGNFVVALRDVGIWPIQAQSLLQLKEGIAQMHSIEVKRCNGAFCGCYKATNINSWLSRAADDTYASVKGVCLDCIKREHLGTTGTCRVPHP